VLFRSQRVAVAIFSYDGWINFGYIADGVAFADIDRLAGCMEGSFQELVEVARPAEAVEPVEREPLAAV